MTWTKLNFFNLISRRLIKKILKVIRIRKKMKRQFITVVFLLSSVPVIGDRRCHSFNYDNIIVMMTVDFFLS